MELKHGASVLLVTSVAELLYKGWEEIPSIVLYQQPSLYRCLPQLSQIVLHNLIPIPLLQDFFTMLFSVVLTAAAALISFVSANDRIPRWM